MKRGGKVSDLLGKVRCSEEYLFCLSFHVVMYYLGLLSVGIASKGGLQCVLWSPRMNHKHDRAYNSYEYGKGALPSPLRFPGEMGILPSIPHLSLLSQPLIYC